MDVGRVRHARSGSLHAAVFGPHDEGRGAARLHPCEENKEGGDIVKGNAGTWFALIGGGLLIYFFAQSLSNATGAVQSAINTGQVGK